MSELGFLNHNAAAFSLVRVNLWAGQPDP